LARDYLTLKVLQLCNNTTLTEVGAAWHHTTRLIRDSKLNITYTAFRLEIDPYVKVHRHNTSIECSIRTTQWYATSTDNTLFVNSFNDLPENLEGLARYLTYEQTAYLIEIDAPNEPGTYPIFDN
jgi:hypothetical protein